MSRTTSPRKQMVPWTPLPVREQSVANTPPGHFDGTEIDNPVHISPSKARANQLLNHDINTITAWLENVLDVEPLPQHFAAWQDEVRSGSANNTLLRGDVNDRRGNGVLEALKALRQANLMAEHLKGLVRNAELEELEARERDEHMRYTDAIELMHELSETFERHRADDLLKRLSRNAVVLGLNEKDVDVKTRQTLEARFSESMLQLLRINMTLEKQIDELKSMAASLHTVQAGVFDLSHSHQQREAASERLRARTAQFNRDTRSVNLRNSKQEDQLRVLERQMKDMADVHQSIQSVMDTRRRIACKQARVAGLQSSVAALQS